MTIIAAVDDDERSGSVLREAADLAAAFDDPLVAIHVMDREEFAERSDGRPGYTLETGEANAEQTATEAAQSIADRVSDVEPVGRVGNPVKHVIAEADDRDARYLVVSGRRRSPSGKALFGSVTQSIILNASRPVLTVLRE